jgi:hypothetical protein
MIVLKLLSSVVTGLFFGLVMGCSLLLLLIAGLLAYAMFAAPQLLHLAFFSLPLLDLQTGQSFALTLRLPGPLYIAGLLGLICACLFWGLRLRNWSRVYSPGRSQDLAERQ